jgi:hypothetical protein
MSADTAELPPIEGWWPYITIGARHWIIEHPHAPWPERVRSEIGNATGRTVPEGADLSDDDRQFVAMQIEPVE